MHQRRSPGARRLVTITPLPGWLHGLSLLGLAYLVVPILLMGARVPWATLPTHLATPAAQDALRLSLLTAGAAVIIDLIVGIPLAVYLASDNRGVRLARILVTLPLSLPPVVAGIALLAAFGRKGLIGAALDAIGVQIAFSTVAVVLAQVFVSLPFLVVTLEAALRSRPKGLEAVAQTLGASPTAALRDVTLPQVVPGLVRGSALALARCLGEFGATLTFAGSLQGVTRTMPLQIYLAREEDQATALSLGILLVGLAVVVLAITEWTNRVPARVTHPDSPDDNRTVGEGAPSRPGSTSSSDGSAPAPSAGVPIIVHGAIAARDWMMDLAITPGQVTAVMGHNGAGKSTLAQVIAGTLALDSGTVMIGEQTVDGPNGFVRARDRHVAVVTQAPNLFTSMTVLANVAAPLRWRGMAKADAQSLARTHLAAVGCAHLADVSAAALSGGQAARVAFARAMVGSPAVLILDEPTAALDGMGTAQLQRLIASHVAHHGITTILITHDVVEALQLAQTLVVLGDGRVAEQGDPAGLMRSPTTMHGARLAGFNVITGHVTSTDAGLPALLVADGTTIMGTREAGDPTFTEGQAAAALFTPESVAIYTEVVAGSPRSSFPGVVQTSTQADGLVSVAIQLDLGTLITARVTTQAWADLALHPGRPVWATVKATQTRIVPLPASA